MSADNYYRVCKHPKGGFTAVMGFMSNNERPEPSEASPQFDDWQQAYAFADQDFIIEYGIDVDPDCIDDSSPTRMRQLENALEQIRAYAEAWADPSAGDAILAIIDRVS